METKFTNKGLLTFSSDFKNLVKVENLVEEACSYTATPEDFYGNVLIAVTEAVNNAIQHGNNSDSLKQVSILYSLDNNHLFFEVIDCGKGFLFNNLPDPTAPENIENECGRGVFLMRSLADNVEFLENGSHVKLTFNL